MKLNHTDTIRLNIMLIAVLGGLLFLCYLLANVYMARQNAQRLERLLYQEYPVIEQIRVIKQDTQLIRDAVLSAVGWESDFLLEESDEIALRLKKDTAELRRLDPNLDSFTRHFETAFQIYYGMARSLAEKLIEQPSSVHLYRSEVDQTNLVYEQLHVMLDQTLDGKQLSYKALLKKTNTSVEEYNFFGAVLGSVVIVALVGLAWGISLRVIHEINRTNRLKDEFLATISHELRTPMNGVMGALSLLSTSALSDSQINWLRAATRSADAMMLSIDDILQLSEVMSGRYCLTMSSFDIAAQLKKLLGLFASEIETARLTVNIAIDPRLQGQLMHSDEEKVFLVLRHLLSNAIKFSQHGGRVDVQVAPSSRKPDCVKVMIKDSGPGVPDQKLPELFNPFQQLDGSFTRKFQGMGIGLAIIKALVHILEGSVKLENHPQGGLVACFYFPSRPMKTEVGQLDAEHSDVKLITETASVDPVESVKQQDHQDTMTPMKAVPAPQKVAELKAGRPRILVVEDNQVNQMVLKGYLKKLGCEVLTANNGKEALAELKKGPVDLVFMDCQMPVMDGFEAARRIREMAEPHRSLPIIAVTANAMDRDREQCQEAGMNGYLKKPVNIEKIQAELKSRFQSVA